MCVVPLDCFVDMMMMMMMGMTDGREGVVEKGWEIDGCVLSLARRSCH